MEIITELRELELLEAINTSNLTNDIKMDVLKLIEFHENFRMDFEVESTD